MAINSGYSVGQPLTGIFPSPIVATVDPTANKKAEIGQIWVNTVGGSAFILAGITAAGSNWVQLVANGGGVFANIVVAGTANIGGDITAGANLTVAGTTALTGDVTTTGDLTVGTDLGVVGAVNFAQPLITFNTGTTPVGILTGTGSPNGVVTATQGSIFLRTDGAAATTLYVNTDGAMAWSALT